ncbi:hypothetical protein DACRYDRAFT_106579 [Dacryopinax primogenitus]|uniref:Replication factor A C-terminal domain-containing protein n=1 Tax=Dacryopinax primogenitus (strain DJM 731) TaxID=1858805 RepID=M5G415_DACPD|nr:uncharacterized protein DACRYDRAFT_106579 [Dacryopinax primogenitus]EJU03419.1 hypothetical protein DACRYDRAFT_106579 [Dacryopinax primogenitus]
MRSASVALDGSTQQASTKQKSRMLCEVQVVDKEGHVVRVTMWNSRAKIFSGKHGQVLHVMNSVVEHRGGVTLNSSEKTEFPLNPKIEEADELKQWFTDGFDEAALKHISCGYSKEGGLTSTTLEELPKVLTKAQVRASRLGHGDCIDYFNMVENISGFQEGIMYQSCGFQGCRESLEKHKGDCPVKEHTPQPDEKQYKYKIGFTTGEDENKVMLLTVFSPAGTMIIGAPATEMYKMEATPNTQYMKKLEEIITSGTFHKLLVRVSTRHWMDVNNWEHCELQYHVVSAWPAWDTGASEEVDTSGVGVDEPADVNNVNKHAGWLLLDV